MMSAGVTLRTTLSAKNHILIILLVTLCMSYASGPVANPEELGLPDINALQDLKKHTVFSFAIMSDNKGNSPENSLV